MLSDEVAAVWRVPLRTKVRVELREHDLGALVGRMEVARSPAFPFRVSEPLFLRIGNVEFTDRQIASWVLVD